MTSVILDILKCKLDLVFSFADCVYFYTWFTQEVNMTQHIFQCPSLSIILTLSHDGGWFPFSFSIWSVIPDFSIYPRTSAFRCSCSLTFRWRHVSPLYTLPLLHGQINNRHLRKAGGYSGRNVVLQLTAIKMRTTVRKITPKIFQIKPHLKSSDR